VNTSGAAPVPPSPPSIVMKSGARPVVRSAAPARARSHLADGGLDADGQAGGVGEALDEVEHRRDVVERGVAGRADARRCPAGCRGCGRSRGDLGGRQHAAQAGLGALAELELDGADRRRATVSRKRSREKLPAASRQPK
jgi:hypothetical protein